MAVYDGVVEAFALRLASNNTREEEFLGKTRITTAIAKSIAKNLAKNTTLKRFGLYSNNLSVDGICAIVTALGDNCTIEEFHLWRNSTGHRGAMALADTLKKNTTLRVVTLSCNDILVKGSRAIAQALEKNTTLVEIGLGGNEIDFKSFARSLKTNTSLRAINLSGNVFAGVGSSKVATAFGTDEESEQPAYSNIGTDGARALLSALRVNTTVTSLSVFCIGQAGGIISQALRVNMTLTHLHAKCIGAETTVALGLALRDQWRPEAFTLDGILLKRAWSQLGLPKEGKEWDNARVLEEWGSMRTKLLAFGMGMHHRLGGGGGGGAASVVNGFDGDVFRVIGRLVWGATEQQFLAVSDAGDDYDMDDDDDDDNDSSGAAATTTTTTAAAAAAAAAAGD